MKEPKSFIAQMFWVFLALLVISGGVFVYDKTQREISLFSTPASSTAIQEGAPSGKLNTYPKNGFKFQYPATWKMIEKESLEIILISPDASANDITLSISPLAKEEAFNIVCQYGGEDTSSLVDNFHSEECKNLKNTNEVEYARVIIAGMSTKQTHKERRIKAYFLNAQTLITLEATMTDALGHTAPSTVFVFDAIVQSFKFR